MLLLDVHETMLVNVVRHEIALTLVDLAKMSHKQVSCFISVVLLFSFTPYRYWIRSFSLVGNSYCGGSNYNHYWGDFGIHKV